MSIPLRKKDFIQRAHSNPFADQHIFIPQAPFAIDWSSYYKLGSPPAILDLGCGYGRYLHHLALKYPMDNIIGFEIRRKVAEYAALKCKTLTNAAVICTNGMLFLQNFFDKGTLKKIFVIFPDPHFKVRKRKARIVSKQMLDVFYYLLMDAGFVHFSTDVEELFDGMFRCFDDHWGFERIVDTEIEESMKVESDEAKRAGAKAGRVYVASFRKVKVH